MNALTQPKAADLPSVVRNAFTVDVEDYFQVSAFAKHLPPSIWPSLTCRVERNIDRLLALLDERQVKSTFFMLGWIAERYPSMATRIVSCGHELASHGYAHQKATEQTLAEFSHDIKASKTLLEDITGVAVLGYRAPSFSIDTRCTPTMEALLCAGYRYSSSLYPIRHDHYGAPDAPRFAFHPQGQAALLELPITTVRLFNHNLPAGGGGYFRLYPYAVSRWCLQHVNRRDRQEGIFYFHPWELDPEQPRPRGLGAKTRFRHYVNLHRTERRIRALLSDFQWDRIDNIFLERR